MKPTKSNISALAAALIVSSLTAVSVFRASTDLSTSQDTRQQAQVIPRCVRAGCSGQLCVLLQPGQEPPITTCEWLPEYACYQQAECKFQPDETCGFTPTEELKTCLADIDLPITPEYHKADINRDGAVGPADYEAMLQALRDQSSKPYSEFTGDAIVDIRDFSMFVHYYVKQ